MFSATSQWGAAVLRVPDVARGRPSCLFLFQFLREVRGKPAVTSADGLRFKGQKMWPIRGLGRGARAVGDLFLFLHRISSVADDVTEKLKLNLNQHIRQ